MALEPTEEQLRELDEIAFGGDSATAHRRIFDFVRNIVAAEAAKICGEVRDLSTAAHDEECWYMAADQCLMRILTLRAVR